MTGANLWRSLLSIGKPRSPASPDWETIVRMQRLVQELEHRLARANCSLGPVQSVGSSVHCALNGEDDRSCAS